MKDLNCFKPIPRDDAPECDVDEPYDSHAPSIFADRFCHCAGHFFCKHHFDLFHASLEAMEG